jgi:starch-binding outer membrane protein, SusD/RagB family
MNTKYDQPFSKSILLIVLSLATACEDFVTLDPPQTSLTTVTVFADESTALSAINNIYIEMTRFSSSFVSGERSLTNMGGMAADELLNFSNTNEMAAFASNEVTPQNTNISAAWNQLYKLIYQTNAVIRGAEQSTSLNDVVKKQVIAEAHFLRAYFHLQLTSFWGDVPWIAGTDYQENAVVFRTEQQQVYQNIIADLELAKENLVAEIAKKIRPNKYSAAALLARVYLYTGQYEKAESQASEVIAMPYQLEPNLNESFLIASRETIWNLQSVVPRTNSWDGATFILIAAPTVTTLNPQLVSAFETGDKRRVSWVGTFTTGGQTWYYPFKYKVRRLPATTSPKTEYHIICRLAEQYLIRAEARTNLNKLTEARSDLNMIRSRAGLPASSASTQATLLQAIEQERRVELFAENSHRWLDLKRTNRSNAVIGPLKSGWQPTDILFPIPQSERNRNSNLSQNLGY